MVLEWYNDTPHSDDADRNRAVADGLVGQNCKMGGPAIMLFLTTGHPCDFCPMVDRSGCGGRPKAQNVFQEKPVDAEEARAYNETTSAEAHRTDRERYRRMLDLAFREKEELK